MNNEFKMSICLEYDGDRFCANHFGTVAEVVKHIPDYDFNHIIRIIILPIVEVDDAKSNN